MAVGRFQVMAVLQAARAYVLGMPLESAKSWGLNRAIFYAAAKRGLLKHKALRFEDISLPRKVREKEEVEQLQKSFTVHHLGDEYAYSVELDGKRLFVIGNEIQTLDRFEKQVGRRFGKCFDKAWEEAVNICKGCDKGILLSQRYFYELIYKPRRDELASKWTQLVEESE